MRVLIGQGQEKGSHGADTGLSGESISLSGKVLFWVALRLPYLLGTLCHHEEAGLPDGEQQHRAAGYLLQILRRGASAEPETDGSRQLYTVEGRSLIRTFAGYATKKPTIDTTGGSKL